VATMNIPCKQGHDCVIDNLSPSCPSCRDHNPDMLTVMISLTEIQDQVTQ